MRSLRLLSRERREDSRGLVVLFGDLLAASDAPLQLLFAELERRPGATATAGHALGDVALLTRLHRRVFLCVSEVFPRRLQPRHVLGVLCDQVARLDLGDQLTVGSKVEEQPLLRRVFLHIGAGALRQ